MREEQYFYHVVTEKTMEIGQVIVFDEHHKNGVYNRTYNFEFRNSKGKTALEIVKERIKDGKLSLNEEDTNVVSNYLEWATKGYRELILEIERKRENKEVPSRMACLYVSKKLEDAKNGQKALFTLEDLLSK